MGQLEGKRAVIIGASLNGNIGQAMARRFRDEGAAVLVASRNADASAAFAESIGGHSAACDITQRDQLFALADSAKQQMGGIDIAVNSTGLALGGPFLEFPEQDLDTLIALQFKGSFFFLQAMVSAMLVGRRSIGLAPGHEVFDRCRHGFVSQFRVPTLRRHLQVIVLPGCREIEPTRLSISGDQSRFANLATPHHRFAAGDVEFAFYRFRVLTMTGGALGLQRRRNLNRK